jgi:tryptophan synthase beta chain
MVAETLDGKNSYRAGPDEKGRFGLYGGRFVAETLMPLILDLEQAYDAAQNDPAFTAELEDLQTHYVGRPSPLYFAERLSEHYGGAKIYLKRDELNHTGSHKINNCLGQILLAKRMGKTRIIAETGAGQHGVAVATVAARFGLPCTVFMGATDIERQKPNVFRMKLLGADIRPVTAGAGTLKDAMNEALRDWVANVDDTFYIIGTVAGPRTLSGHGARFPIDYRPRKPKQQMLEREGRLPDSLGGMYWRRLQRDGPVSPVSSMIQMLTLSASKRAGLGLDTPDHAASLAGGRTRRLARQPHLFVAR